MKNSKEEFVEKYVNMPHAIQIKEDSGGFVVTIPDLPGCISQGDSIEEAYEMIMDAKRGWIEVALDESYPISEPSEEKKFSGKILLRIPKKLHADLVKNAQRENVSLNQYLLYLLTKRFAVELHIHHTNRCDIQKVIVDNTGSYKREMLPGYSNE